MRVLYSDQNYSYFVPFVTLAYLEMYLVIFGETFLPLEIKSDGSNLASSSELSLEPLLLLLSESESDELLLLDERLARRFLFKETPERRVILEPFPDFAVRK